jgi:hypothetical protein
MPSGPLIGPGSSVPNGARVLDVRVGHQGVGRGQVLIVEKILDPAPHEVGSLDQWIVSL